MGVGRSVAVFVGKLSGIFNRPRAVGARVNSPRNNDKNLLDAVNS